jgi:hypothetical protein
VREGARNQDRELSIRAMSTRTAALITWSMCALSLALTALSLLLLTLNVFEPDVHVFEHWIENTASAIGFSTVGAVVVSRRHPRDPIGWLFCVVGFLFAVVHFVAEYAIYALLTEPGWLPAGEAAAWIYSWLFAPQLGLGGLLLLLYPNGRLPSARWRWFVRFSVLATSVTTLMAALSPGEIDIGLGPIHNPLGIEGLPNVYKLAEALLLSMVLVAGSAQVLRLRRTRGAERQQIKWFAYAVTATAIGGLLRYVIPVALGAPWLQWVGFVPLVVGVVSIPIAMGIAILKYRLYEIDIIINRTVVYGAVTVVLAGLYQAIDEALHYLLVTLTHLHSLPGSIIAALAIAALFHPVKHRIQHLVDGYFPSEESGMPGRSEEANPS